MSTDDPNARKKKPPRIWHEQHEKILKEWGEASSCYRHMHFRAFQINKVWSMSFTLPVIIISTITGTANFAQKTFPPSVADFIPSIIGAFNLFAAIMTTIAQFLKVTELMESHRVTSIQYGKLSRRIKLELTLPMSERTQHGDNMVEMCRAEYDRLIEQSPPVPKAVIQKFELRFPESNVFFRPELSNIHPITLFDNEKEEERLKEKKKKEQAEKRELLVLPPFRQNVINELHSLTRRGMVSRFGVPSRPARELDFETPSSLTVTEGTDDVEVVVE
jgi:hypothetical protein